MTDNSRFLYVNESRWKEIIDIGAGVEIKPSTASFIIPHNKFKPRK